jgi:hypothetical protein
VKPLLGAIPGTEINDIPESEAPSMPKATITQEEFRSAVKKASLPRFRL